MGAREDISGMAAAAITVASVIQRAADGIHGEITRLEAAHPEVDFGPLRADVEALASTRPGKLINLGEPDPTVAGHEPREPVSV